MTARPLILRRSRRGAALMIVLVMLMLLLAMAVPFFFTMSQQEGTAAGSMAGEDARIAARTGADHALARLHRANRLVEWEKWYATAPEDLGVNFDDPLFDSPHYDSNREIVVDAANDFLRGMYPRLIDQRTNLPRISLEDPYNLVAGINVRDESGKVDLNSAPPLLIGNLLGGGVVTDCDKPSGLTFSYVTLDNAEFLNDREVLVPRNVDDGPGLVVIGDILFRFEKRRHNTLIEVSANAPYPASPAIFGVMHPDIPPMYKKAMVLGKHACSPLAYKMAYWRAFKSRDGRTPHSFNNLGEVRDIARETWFPGWLDMNRGRGFWEGIDPITYLELPEIATVIEPTRRFDGRFFYPQMPAYDPRTNLGGVHTFQQLVTRKELQVLWLDPQNQLPAELYHQTDPRHRAHGFGRGTMIRVSQQGGESRLMFVIDNGRPEMSTPPWTIPTHTLAVNQGIVFGQREPVLIEVAERASVNINTASFAVLKAMVLGIGGRLEISTGDVKLAEPPIFQAAAEEFALRVLARTRYQRNRPENYKPFTGAQDYFEFLTELLEDGVIGPTARNALVMQQLYPNLYSYTAPFSFDSLDTYTINSMAVRYGPGGGELARAGFREQVQIGSDDWRTVRWRLWESFSDEMRQPQGNVFQRYLGGSENHRATGVVEVPILHWDQHEKFRRTRWEHLTDPFGRNAARRLDVANMAGFTPNPDNPPVPGSGDVFFDYVYTDANGNQKGDLTAGHLAFWFKPHGELGLNTRVIFDTAESNRSNRMSLLWWGGRRRGHRLSRHNSGLVFRIKDRTLESAYTECRFEMAPDMFRPGHWYHISLNWKGTHLSECSMIIDGDGVSGQPGRVRLRGITDHTFFRDRTDWVALTRHDDWVARTSTLQDDIVAPDNNLVYLGGGVGGWAQYISPSGMSPALPGFSDIRIDQLDIGAFEPVMGVVQVGDEVIEYTGTDGSNRLLRVVRGARGTPWRDHPRDAKITVHGYTTQVQGTNHPNRREPKFPFLPATTASLRSAMGNRPCYRMTRQGNTSSYPSHFIPAVFGPDAGFVNTGPGQGRLQLSNYAGLQERGIVAVVGIAWRGYIRDYPIAPYYPDFEPTSPMIPDYPAAGPTQMRWTTGMIKMEFVHYDGYDDSGLNVVNRYDQNFVLKTPDQYWQFAPSYTPSQMYADPAIPTDVALSEFFSRGTLVVPVSIDCTNLDGYHDHSIVALDDEWFFYSRRFAPLTGGGQLLVYDEATDILGWALSAGLDFNNPGLAMPDSVLPHLYRFRGELRGFSFGATMVGYGVIGPSRGDATHASGTPIIPCFLTTQRSGKGDLVTLINGKNNEKEQHRIRKQHSLGGFQVASLDSHVLYTRPQGSYICKFPTGELPVELPTNWSFAGPDPRTTDSGTHNEGSYDSFEIRRYVRGNFRLVQPLTDRATSGYDIQVNGITGLARGVGVIRIDDELIAYRGVATIPIERQVMINGQWVTQTIITHWLLDCERGALGTVAAAHAAGSSIMNLASIRIGRPPDAAFPTWGTDEPPPPVQTFITRRDRNLRFVVGDTPFRNYGFMRIEQGYFRTGSRKLEEPIVEFAGYQRIEPEANPLHLNRRQDNLTCQKPVAGMFNMLGYPAVFRGAYGTVPRDFSNYALYYEQPVRFPDWFPGVMENHAKIIPRQPDAPQYAIPGCQSPEIQYFQGAITLRNTDFDEIRWQLNFAPHADAAQHADSIAAKLVVRFDGKGEWGSTPTNRPGGLYEFDFDINGPNTKRINLGVYEQRDHPARPSWVAAQGTGRRDKPMRADRMEWRLYYYFLPGAFDRDDWKITLQLNELSVDVKQHTRILRHEEQR